MESARSWIAIVAAAAISLMPARALANSATDFVAFIKPFTPDAFAEGFATLVGALIGAMLAYALQRLVQ
jgi:hypothetical protein